MKCDELKVQKIGDLCFDFKMGKNIEPNYYRKSEVDAAIDELKEEVKKTQELANEQTFKLCVEKEIKRAEAMARQCAAQYWTMRVKATYETDIECRLFFMSRYHFWKRWNKRWLEIADKLKE